MVKIDDKREVERYSVREKDDEKDRIENDDFAAGRRDFLKTTGRLGLTLAAALSGLEGLVGCAGIPRISDNRLNQKRTQYHASLDDPHNLLPLLEEDEYFIPDEIFTAYAKTVDKTPQWAVPQGGYLHRNYLDTRAEVDEFVGKLEKLGLSEQDVSTYYSIFARPKTIIFRASLLKNKKFLEKVIPHERTHRELAKLNLDDKKYLAQVSKQMMNQRYLRSEMEAEPELFDDSDQFSIDFMEKQHGGKCTKRNLCGVGLVEGSGFYLMGADMNWEEFYTYLSQDEFKPRAEAVLKRDHPKAYQMFNQIRGRVKLVK